MQHTNVLHLQELLLFHLMLLLHFQELQEYCLKHLHIYFQHNKVNQELDYILEIYSITGALVKRIERSSYIAEGYRIGPIRWDGKDNYGSKIGAGMYIANLAVTEKNGDFSSKSIRIILIP